MALLTLIGAVVVARGAAAEPACSSEVGMSAQNFPPGVSSAAILKLAGLGPGVCGAMMREWPRSPGTFILYTQSADHFALHLLQKRDQTFAVIGSLRQEVDDLVFRGFDFAPFKLRKDQVAFGVRLEARGATKGGFWQCGSLRLYTLIKGKLEHVLSTLMSYSAEGNDVAYDIDSGYSEEASATLAVGKPDESGYNTLIKKVGRRRYVYSFADGQYSGPDEPACLENVVHCFCQD